MKWLALGLALVPQNLAALSCLAPDVEATYAEALASEARYSVLYGQLHLDEEDLPPSLNSSFTPASPVAVPARFEGAYLVDGAFVGGYETSMSLLVECAGPWCGSATDGAEYLLFAEHHAGGLQVILGACVFWAFQDPTQAQLAYVERANR